MMRAKARFWIVCLSLLLVGYVPLYSVSARAWPVELALTATLEETWHSFGPAGWVTSTPVACVIRVTNPSGFIDIAQYQYAIDGTWTDWATEGLQITQIDATTRQLTVFNLPFYTSLTPDQNQIRFRIYDGIGLLLMSPVNSVQVDTSPPSSAVNTSGCYGSSWSGQISGTASDSGSGVGLVEITIRRGGDSLYYNGSSWQVTPSWLAAAGAVTWSYAFAPAAGDYTVQSRATDVAGLLQVAYGVSSFVYDAVPPQSTIQTQGYFARDTWPGQIIGSAADAASGVTGVQISLQRASDNLYYDGASWVLTERWLPTSLQTAGWRFAFTPSGDTRYEVRSRATDGCGNVQSTYGAATFTYDTSAPASPSSLVVTPGSWSATNLFQVVWSNPADLAGIAVAHYKWDSAPTSNADEAPGSPAVGADIHSISGLAVPSQGAHQLFVWLEDLAGNVDYRNALPTGAGAFKWDSLPPATLLQNLTGHQGCSGWYTSTIQVTLTAVDATSAVSATFWRKDGGAWQPAVGLTLEVSGDGAHAVEYYSVDLAGNSEPVRTLTPPPRIDTVAPATNQPSYTGTLGRNGWYTSTVLVSLAGIDATSGVSATYRQLDGGALQLGGSFSVITDGVHTLLYYSVDSACNQETPQTAAPLKIDRTYPSTSQQLVGTAGENGWFRASPVTVTLTATDAMTGVAQSSGLDKLRYRTDVGSWLEWGGTTVSFPVALPPGQSEYLRTVEYYATDLAGNAEAIHTISIGIDLRAPPAINRVPIVLPSGWTRINCFSIAWDENPYDVSGIGGVYYSFHIPTSPTDGTLVPGDDIKSIACVQLPPELGDGAHNVYLWLRDKAGNTDHQTRREVTLRFDQTPPQVGATVRGSLCDVAGWYNSPITVTFVATDNVPSGMVGGAISYHVIGSGSWVTGSTYVESRDGRYTVEALAIDAAGNPSSIVTTTVRLDRTAPAAPIGIQVEPSGWSRLDSFAISWLSPSDLSGLAGVYYKRGSPPIAPSDGTYVDGSWSSLSNIAALTEGETPLYLWLADKACNVDHQRRSLATLKYDRTPPNTNYSLSGTLGGDGWYLSPVQVTLVGTDGASGRSSSSYRIGDGPWQTGTIFTVQGEGSVAFSYYSVDAAGNSENVRTAMVKADRTAPSSRVYADSYSPSPSFTVRWDGSDASSGLAGFDVQYRVGTTGVWQDWVTSLDPLQKSRLFTGVPGKTYYFRSRARDKAGNVAAYPPTYSTYVSVDPLINGDFSRDLSVGWETKWEGSSEMMCPPARVTVQASSGGTTWAAVLGCPNQKDPAPVGMSRICQTLNVPTAQDMSLPVLHFRYHIFTYDVVYGPNRRAYFDTFNAGVWPQGQIAPTWVFTDGNWTDSYGQLLDLGWRDGAIDLAPYAGQTVEICLATIMREEPSLNTWTFVDDVQVVNLEYRLYLPIIKRVMAAPVLQAQQRSAPTGEPQMR